MSPLLHTPIHTEAILQPQLVGVKLEIEASSQLARSTVDGLTPRELTQQPGPQSWSVAECLAHLNLTSKAYLSLVTMAIENARLGARYGSAPYRMDWKGYLLWWICERHGRFKTKTTDRFKPLSVEPASQVLPEFLSLQDRLLDCLYRANGLALNRIKVTSPFDNRIQYNLYSCFRLLPAHQRRHLWQAAQARATVTGSSASIADHRID
jgi:DinB superfamily